MNRDEFKLKKIPFDAAVAVIKHLANARFGKGNHKFTINSYLPGKISITKELKGSATTPPPQVPGATVLKFLDKYSDLLEGIAEDDLLSQFTIMQQYNDSPLAASRKERKVKVHSMMDKFAGTATDSTTSDAPATIVSTPAALSPGAVRSADIPVSAIVTETIVTPSISTIRTAQPPSAPAEHAVQLPSRSSHMALETFEQIITVLNSNAHDYVYVNLEGKSLNAEQIRQLDLAVSSNSHVGYIKWGQIPIDTPSSALKLKIEAKLSDNNRVIDRFHPSDYIASLLSMHAYEKLTEVDTGQPVTFKPAEISAAQLATGVSDPKEEKKTQWNAALTDWVIYKVYDVKKEAGYFGVAYLNIKKGQLVFAHRGMELSFLDLLKNDSSMKTSIESVYGSQIGSAQAAAYGVTLDIVSAAKETGLHLTFTGHALGAWYAELSLYYCHYDDYAKLPGVKSIGFDSPGSSAMIEQYKSTIDSYATRANTDIMNMVTYLSIPNIANICNGHLGRVYTLFPEIHAPKILDQAGNMVASAKGNRFFGKIASFVADHTGVESKLAAAKAMFGGMIEGIVDQFDPITGKPREYKQVMDWPVLSRSSEHSSAPSQLGQLTDALASSVPGGAIAKFIGGKLASKAVDIALGDRTATRVLGMLQDIMNGGVDFSSFFEIYNYLDDGFRMRTDLSDEDKFMATYSSHLKIVEVNDEEDVLIPGKGTIDWYLNQINQYGLMAIGKKMSPFLKGEMDEFASFYDIIPSVNDGKNYLRILNPNYIPEVIRVMMERYLQLDLEGEIRLGIKNRKKFQLEVQNQAQSSDSSFKLTSEITKPISNFVGRKAELEKLQQLHNRGEQIVLLNAFGGTGKTSMAIQYGNIMLNDGYIVRWFSEGDIIRNYADIAELVGISSVGVEPEDVRKRVHYKLASMEASGVKLLFIFDNLDHGNYLDAKNYVETLPKNVKVLITTRDPELGVSFRFEHQAIEIGEFSEEEVIEYARKTSGLSAGEISKLTREVGTLPLRLSMALTALKDDETLSVDDYISLLRDMKRDGKEHPEIEMVLGKLFTRGDSGLAGWKLLQYLANFDPDFVPLSIFKGCDDIISSTEFSEGTKALKSLSIVRFITGEDGSKGFKFHRFIRDETKEYARIHGDRSISQEELLSKSSSRLATLFPEVTNLPDESWQRAKGLAASAKAIITQAESSEPSFTGIELSELLDRMGEYSSNIDLNFQASLEYELKALAMKKCLY